MTSDPLTCVADRYWQFSRQENPLQAIQAGQPLDDNLLLREGPDDHRRRSHRAAELLDDLRRIDPGPLSAEDQTTWHLLDHELELLIEKVQAGAHLRPSLYPIGPDFALRSWAAGTVLVSDQDARRYLARLATIPAALAGLRDTLEEGIKHNFRYSRIVIALAVTQLRNEAQGPAAADVFLRPLALIAGRSPAFASLAAEGRAIVDELILPALLSHAEFLEQRVGAAARDTIACTADKNGEAYYRFMIRQATTLNLAPGTIHDLGLAEVERLTAEMTALVATTGCGGLEEFRAALRIDQNQFAASASALLDEIAVLCKRIDGRIPEFFGRIPRMTYGVRSIPEATASNMPPAYAQPNPADRSSAGIHWVTSIPGKCPRYMHIPLALHEGWPGHLMHLALIQEMDHLPDFRRHGALGYSACLEGWALYAEGLGEDMGFYDTPEKRFGRLEMEMWRAVRLVVDTGIHDKGWTRATAAAYFEQHLAMPRSTIEAEVDRYIGWPGQALGYQLGNLKFRELRLRAEKELGRQFRIRDFHDALMAAGPVTLPLLDRLMTDWLRRQALHAA